MTTPDNPRPAKALRPDSREARLKAALKANMGRRKLQARERAAMGDEREDQPRPDGRNED